MTGRIHTLSFQEHGAWGKYNVHAVGKAVHAMHQRCTALCLCSPATICKLFEVIVTCSEYFLSNCSIAEGAKVSHRQFMKHMLGVRKCTASQTVFAEIRSSVRRHCVAIIVLIKSMMACTATDLHVACTTLQNWTTPITWIISQHIEQEEDRRSHHVITCLAVGNRV